MCLQACVMILCVSVLSVYFSGQPRAEENGVNRSLPLPLFFFSLSAALKTFSFSLSFSLHLSLSLHAISVNHSNHFPPVKETLLGGSFMLHLTYYLLRTETLHLHKAEKLCSSRVPIYTPCTCHREDESSGCSQNSLSLS